MWHGYLQVAANVADVLAGLAILVAAVRAWPLIEHMELLAGARKYDKQKLIADFARLEEALASYRDTPCPRLRTAKQAAECLLDTIDRHNASLHFDIQSPLEVGQLTGLIRYRAAGYDLTNVCRLSMDGYRALLDQIRSIAGVDADAEDAGARIRRDNSTVLVDFVRGLDGPLCALMAVSNDSVTLSLQDLRLAGSRMWRLVKPVIDSMQGMVVIAGEPFSAKSTTATAILNDITTRHNEKCVVVTYDADVPLANVTQISIGTSSAEQQAAWRRAMTLAPQFIFLRDATVDTIPDLWRAYGGPQLVLTQLNAREAVAGLVEFNRHRVAAYQAIEWPFVIVGQWLARKLCDQCKRKTTPDNETMVRLNKIIEQSTVDDRPMLADNFCEPVGCEECQDGYRGRVAVTETLIVNQPLQEASAHGATFAELRKLAIDNGMITLQMNAVELASQGAIDLESTRDLSRHLDYSLTV